MTTPSSNHGQSCWCRANYCARRVAPGLVLCVKHALRLGQIDRAALDALARIDPRGVESRPCNLDTVYCLDAIAQAVEALAQSEGYTLVNVYRLRAIQLRAILERAERVPDPLGTTAGPPAVQGRLIPELEREWGPERDWGREG
jgi:hypothetical protein